jgi:hypothetical protein
VTIGGWTVVLHASVNRRKLVPWTAFFRDIVWASFLGAGGILGSCAPGQRDASEFGIFGAGVNS